MSNKSSILSGNSIIVTPSTTIAIGAWLSAQAYSAGLQYVDVLAVDRSEYTVGMSGNTGAFIENGKQVQFSGQDGDARFVDLQFNYNATTGLFQNANLDSLNSLQYLASPDIGDMASISIYSTSPSPDPSLTSSDLYGYIYGIGATDYVGSYTVVSAANPVSLPSYATPDSVAAAALSQVGTTVNDQGCWVLASKIAAQAGAALPISSIAAGAGGQGNGEWQVAYDGLVSTDPNWTSALRTGDVVAFVTASGGGHITTVASGSGQSAELVDNITIEDSAGHIFNSASDGDASDVIVQGPHLASNEFTGVDAANVVVYRLDTPIVETRDGSDFLADEPTGSVNLGNALAATDPCGMLITSYQVYTPNADSTLSVNGQAIGATTADTAITAVSLADLMLTTDAAFTGGTLLVRAFNGSYWGDWADIAVSPSSQQLSSLLANIPTTAGLVINVPLNGTINTQPGTNTVLFGVNSGTVNSYGNDTIFGGSGVANVTTSDNTVSVLGGSGTLNVNAGAGRTLVVAGTGGLTFSGGGGFDTVIGGGNPVYVTGGTGGGEFFGGGNATITAGAGGTNIEIGGNGDKLYAKGSSGVLFGTSGGNVLMSSRDDNGQNVFFGGNGTGNMTFITGAGDDLLALGHGTNMVTLGSGNDVIFDNSNTTSTSTITAGTGSLAIALGGASVDLIIGAGSAREFDLYNFVPGADRITLTGYSATEATAAIAGQTASGGGTILRLDGGSIISLVGVNHVNAGLFS